jgi:hypothetical protein
MSMVLQATVEGKRQEIQSQRVRIPLETDHRFHAKLITRSTAK